MHRDTSKWAYSDIKSSGTENSQCAVILYTIKGHGGNFSLRELCQATGYEINAVSARCHELKELGKIEEGDVRKCSISGRKIHPLRIPAVGQKALF